MYYVFGLGNPDKKYESSRHNVGQMAIFWLKQTHKFSSWEEKGKQNALISKGTILDKEVFLIISTESMNKSGATAKYFAQTAQKAKKLIVVQDDIDMGFGDVKILFNRGYGGHNGIDSINRSIKKKAYFRIKIGISPKTKSGKLQKPAGERGVVDFVLGNFTRKEKEVLNTVYPRVEKAIKMIVGGELSIQKEKEALSQVIR